MVEALQTSLALAPAHRRISDRVAEELLRLIVTLQLRPGSILNENALMGHLGCGRTPLREALLGLERQYLIKIVPRQATMVTEITLADGAEIYEALRYIEGSVGRLAAERIDDAGLRSIQVLSNNLKGGKSAEGLTGDALYRTAEIDFDFHHAIAQAAANQFLLAAVGSFRGVTMRLMYLSYHQPGTLQALRGEHRKIVDVLKARDPDAAERAMQDHADMNRRRTLESAIHYPSR